MNGGFAQQAWLPHGGMTETFRSELERRARNAKLGLVGDLGTLARRYRIGARAAASHNVTLLCAVKASTHPDVLRLAAECGLGFDIANARELAHARTASPHARVSLTSPAIPISERTMLYKKFARGEIDRWHCDSLAQLEELARACPDSVVGIRVNCDGLDVPKNIPMWTPSRFGIRIDQLSEAKRLVSQYGCQIRWIHMHNGSEENTLESYVFAAKQVMAGAAAHGIELESLDLGGGFLMEADEAGMSAFFGEMRKVVGPDLELVFEPGRFWMIDCMSLVTQVLDIKETEEQIYLVLDLGTLSHVQWADHIRFPVMAHLRPDDQRPWRVCGRSCFEEDMFDEYEVVPSAPDGAAPSVGDGFVLGNISGYAVELSCDFNGVTPPTVELLDFSPESH